ncbi:MAG: zf-HC2 domain-containing protein [Ignavibacteria bacterium]|nr:zf-HC2 domain-containing protein [Ignavibacteria bacterium]
MTKVNNMKHTNCDEIMLMVDDYLDGMISTENRQLMEEHLNTCSGCKKYLEDTVLLLDKAAVLGKDEKMLPKEKQQEMWNSIEAKINASLPVTDPHIYNMSGFEDEYIPVSSANGVNKINKSEKTSASGNTVWGSMRYYMSGIAAVLILAFVIYGVNQFLKRGNDVNLTNGIVEVSGGTKWMVTSIKGSPIINNMVMKAIDSLGIGGYVSTDDSSKAELYVAGLGSVIVEPNSRVKLVKSVEGEHRIQLDYGSIDANIMAKPRTFFVEAGAITAVDLGCSYKFSVDKSGDGLLYVRSGKVSLESAGGRESIVPEGKFCVTKQEFGPGTPFREDSSPKLKKALMEFDFGNCGSQCINTILDNSQKTDAVTLVNILPRVDEQYRTQVYNKVANYCAPPRRIPRDSIPRFNRFEDVDEWVDKIMEEVHKNIEESLQHVEENMKQFDNDKWQKDWEKNWDRSVNKNWNFTFPQGLDTFNFQYDTQNLSKEEQDELNREMKELEENLKVDNEEFKQEMERVKEELKRVNEEIRKNMEDVQKEMRKNSLERRKELRETEKNKQHEDSGDDDDSDDDK